MRKAHSRPIGEKGPGEGLFPPLPGTGPTQGHGDSRIAKAHANSSSPENGGRFEPMGKEGKTPGLATPGRERQVRESLGDNGQGLKGIQEKYSGNAPGGI